MISLKSFNASVREAVHRAAATNVPILLSGETGCGKTVLARLIHEASPRSQRQFTRVDCGSIPDTLFEREMFGHVRGAFTDAKDSQPGLFEATDGGTVFLDEIGEVPLAVQPKLLSVLDEGLVRRIGSTKNTHVDVRIVAASNRDLPDMVRARQFRSDLFYRLGFLRIHLAPLRERRESIGHLAEATLGKLIAEKRVHRTVMPELARRTIDCLQAYEWPGNIRELEQVMTFALTYSDGDVVLPEHLPSEVRVRKPIRDEQQERTSARYVPPQDARTEKHAILEALKACGGNRTKAAERLGMCRATLWTKLRQFGIPAHGATAHGQETDHAGYTDYAETELPTPMIAADGRERSVRVQ
jgi:transcriptional regulator with PAS, ATPase and Fis domain